MYGVEFLDGCPSRVNNAVNGHLWLAQAVNGGDERYLEAHLSVRILLLHPMKFIRVLFPQCAVFVSGRSGRVWRLPVFHKSGCNNQ